MKTILLLTIILLLGCNIFFSKSDWDALPEYKYYRYSRTPFVSEGFERRNGFPVMVAINRFSGDVVMTCKVDTIEHPYVKSWQSPDEIKRFGD